MTEVYFDAIAEDLVTTRYELAVPQAFINEMAQVLGYSAHRNEVLRQ